MTPEHDAEEKASIERMRKATEKLIASARLAVKNGNSEFETAKSEWAAAEADMQRIVNEIQTGKRR